MKKNTLFLIICLTSAAILQAQVPQKVLVEHFTNTRCSFCSSRNPGFYENLNNENVLHVAIHPSAPYSSCLLNQHNKSENDARASYYGVFGSTPRLVIQGSALSPSSDYSSSGIFTPFIDKTSPIAIDTKLESVGDSLKLTTTLKTVATHSFTQLNLVAYALEEVLNYNAPNGESVHYDVFRKSFYPLNGIPVNIPVNVGDSSVFTQSIVKNGVWVLPEIYGMAYLQETTNKQIIQVERSPNLSISIGLNKIAELSGIRIYPNPTNEELKIELADNEQTIVKVIDLTGKVIYQESFSTELAIPTFNFSNGLYIFQINNRLGQSSHKISVSH